MPVASTNCVGAVCGYEPLWSRPHYPAGTASGASASAALAQSTSFCTVGAPLTPIAPTISPSTLMGNPPPHAATRARVGMPASSDGSPLIKLKKSCVETPNRAVYAFFCAISMVGIEAPSIRLKALRLPPSSRIATFSVTPSSLAFATAAFTIFCASSEEMLCFFTTSAIGHRPFFDSICFRAAAVSPSNADVEYRHDVAILGDDGVSLVVGLNSHVYSLWVAPQLSCRRRHAFKNRVACSTKSSGYWWCAP